MAPVLGSHFCLLYFYLLLCINKKIRNRLVLTDTEKCCRCILFSTLNEKPVCILDFWVGCTAVRIEIIFGLESHNLQVFNDKNWADKHGWYVATLWHFLLDWNSLRIDLIWGLLPATKNWLTPWMLLLFKVMVSMGFLSFSLDLSLFCHSLSVWFLLFFSWIWAVFDFLLVLELRRAIPSTEIVYLHCCCALLLCLSDVCTESWDCLLYGLLFHAKLLNVPLSNSRFPKRSLYMALFSVEFTLPNLNCL